MQEDCYRLILNSILEAKKTAVIVFDLDLKILFLSDLAKTLMDRGNKLTNIFGENGTEDYVRILKTGLASDKKIKRINSSFYMSTLSPIKDGKRIIGIIEILETETDSFDLPGQIKNTHIKDYAINEKESRLNLKNGTVYTLDSIVTKNTRMKELIEKAYKTSNSTSPVLIYGETGTGKELFAQGIHNASSIRKNNMFIAQNCAAIPDTLLESLLFGTTEGSFTGARNKPGLFEIAEGGTIYLDEINSMNLNLQSKLLRVIQENTYMPIGGKTVKKSNVRIIASFNENPLQLIKRGRFRRDLYYRLNVIYFKIPCLRERTEDIELLTNYFIRLYNRKFYKNVCGISSEAMKVLQNYKWEGNVRELKNDIERIMNFTEGGIINIEDISNFIGKESAEEDEEGRYHVENEEEALTEIFVADSANKTFREKIENLEIEIIKRALTEAEGNVALAARQLDLPRQTLKNKIVRYGIKPIFDHQKW